jgi:hypothetical protein
LLGISILLSGRKVTALVGIGCEAELIISRPFAQNHGIAAAETAHSCIGIAFPDEAILEATETHSLKLDAGGVKSTCNALVVEITAYDCCAKHAHVSQTILASLHVHRIDRFLVLHFPTYVYLYTSSRSNKTFSNPTRLI